MQKPNELSKNEIEAISHRIADAFYDYKYNSGLLYTTSPNREGYLILAGNGLGRIRFIDGIKMIIAEKKALGGWKKMKAFISACFSDGNTIETRMRKAKRKFIRIEVLVVCQEYQNQGYMRKMMDFVYELANEKKILLFLTPTIRIRV